MANNYFDVVCDSILISTEKNYERLRAVLEKVYEDDDTDEFGHGMECKYYNGGVHMSNKDGYSGNLDKLPPEAFKVIHDMLKEAGLYYWDFGYTFSCDKKRHGEFGGGRLRITRDGRVLDAMLVFEPFVRVDEIERMIKIAHDTKKRITYDKHQGKWFWRAGPTSDDARHGPFRVWLEALMDAVEPYINEED